MVQTRGQERHTAATKTATPPSSKKINKKTEAETSSTPSTRKHKSPDEKQKTDGNGNRPPKRARRGSRSIGKVKERPAENAALKGKLDRVIAEYGTIPLNGLVDEKKWSPSKVVMAYILNALLSSARISHNIASATLECVLGESYHDLQVLHGTTWDQRVDVLSKGGYDRYREKTATYLGELAQLMEEKYDYDASNIFPEGETGDAAGKIVSDRVKEVKGIGPTGVDIFLGTIQHFFPGVSPFLDGRSRKTAVAIGLGDDMDAIFEAAGRDSGNMAKLEGGLTRIRLEKKEGEFA